MNSAGQFHNNNDIKTFLDAASVQCLEADQSDTKTILYVQQFTGVEQ